MKLLMKAFVAVLVIVVVSLSANSVVVADGGIEELLDDGPQVDGPGGWTYYAWTSQGFAPPPYSPFLDCLRFEDDGSFATDQLGPGGVWKMILGVGPNNLWWAFHPAGGLNLLWIGLNGWDSASPYPDALGATLYGIAEQTTFGVGGIGDHSCSLAPAANSSNPYSKR